jgi:hypothetical protein
VPKALLKIILIIVGFGVGQLMAQPNTPTNAELAEEIRKLRLDFTALQADSQVIRTETAEAIGVSQGAQFAAAEALGQAERSLTNDYAMQQEIINIAERIYTKCVIKVPGIPLPDTTCELIK